MGGLSNAFIHSSQEELELGRKLRLQENKQIPFGVEFLDLATNGGFFLNDLVTISARSGKGKTELTNIIAENMARNGKKVLYYGLEMARSEGIMRMEYRQLAKKINERYPNAYFNYQMFEANKLREYEQEFRKEIDDDLNSFVNNIMWRHKENAFYVEDLKRELIENKNKTDTFLVDHLSFIDSNGDYGNKNDKVEQIVTEIKNFCDFYMKPVLLVAHVRKSDRRATGVMPHEEDILGTKHIVNLSSRIIMMSNDNKTMGMGSKFPTLLRVAKNRKGDYVTRYIARVYFDARKNAYEDKFDLLHNINDCLDYKEVQDDEIPLWVDPYAQEPRY